MLSCKPYLGPVILDFVSQTVRQAPTEPLLPAANVFSSHQLKRSNLTSNPGLFILCCDPCTNGISLYNHILMPKTSALQIQMHVHARSAEWLQMQPKIRAPLISNLSLIRLLTRIHNLLVLQTWLPYPRLCVNVR